MLHLLGGFLDMHALSGLGSFMSVLKVNMKISTSWFAWFLGFSKFFRGFLGQVNSELFLEVTAGHLPVKQLYVYLKTFLYSLYCIFSLWDLLVWFWSFFKSVQFSSVAQSCPTLCNPMNHSTLGLPVHHQLLEFTQTHVHWVSDAIQPSQPLSSPSPPAPNPSQHQSLFQWVNSSHEVVKVLEFQL